MNRLRHAVLVDMADIAACVVLAVLIAVAYGGSLANELVFDDAIFMERDPRVASLETASSLLFEPLWGFQDAPGRSGTHQYYRPLQLLPLVIANQWFDGAAWPCHAISLAMHWLIASLVFALLTLVGMRRGVSLAVASVFAVHPGSSEAVLWVADFAGLGVAATTLAILQIHARTTRPSLAFVSIGLLALAGMLSKESGILVAVLMLAYDLLVRPESDRPRSPATAVIGGYAGAAAATAVYLSLRLHALGGVLPGADSLELGAGELTINAVALLPRYVTTFLWPTDLNMYHDFDVVRSLTAPSFLRGCVVIALWSACFVGALVRRRIAAFGLLFAAVAVAPYLLVRWPQLNAYAERYTYLPSIGLLLAIAATLPKNSTSPTTGNRARYADVLIPGLLLGLLLTGFVIADRARTSEWRDEITIYEKTLTQSQRAELIRNNLALRYLSQGTPKLGIPIQERLMELDSTFRSGWHNLGLLYVADNRLGDAREAFEQAVHNEPTSSASWLNLGYARDASGQRVGAIDAYCRSTAFNPRETKALHNLAVIAIELGQPTNAIAALDAIVRAGAEDDAARALRNKAKNLQPRLPSEAHRAAIARQLKRGRDAVEATRWIAAECAFRTAAWLNERAHLPHHYLANSYYLRGRQRDALESERNALRRAPNNALYKKNVASLAAAIDGAADDRSPFAAQ